ncbi:MAG: porin family protein [Bacteroidetes bacterium]|nr:porin family protein [Bacteroidota bacterium]MDA1121885.1 porin family protein [Bacteroidota bacterium]
MQTTNIRYKLGLYGGQIILVIFLLCGLSQRSLSQGMNFGKLHLPAYDERWLHYGFLIGAHQSFYRIDYNEAFTTPSFDSLHSVVPAMNAGFKLGFVVDFMLYQYLSLRITPTVSFYENDIKYRFTDGTTRTETKDATLVELPILLKYRSVRRKNNRMYLLIGASPVIEAAGSKDENDVRERLETRNFNVNLEVGVGTDIFYEFFKFAVELRYSRGLRNLLSTKENIYSAPLSKLTLHNIGLFITFEGGPS